LPSWRVSLKKITSSFVHIRPCLLAVTKAIITRHTI
jgi:hypothetical protein